MKIEFLQLIFIVVLILPTNVKSQDSISSPKNTLLLEYNYNNNLTLTSILYDRTFKSKGLISFGIQTGLSYTGEISRGKNNYLLFLPLKSYILIGKKKHFLEAGLGFRYNEFPYPELNFGYRFIRREKGLCLRTDFTLFALPVKLVKMICISVGYKF